MPAKRCAKAGCEKLAADKQKFCSREHSPFGNMIDTPEERQRSQLTAYVQSDNTEMNDQKSTKRKNKGLYI